MAELKLEPTAALVMRWALPLYIHEQEPIRQFVKQLDLSSGQELQNKCESICHWYGQVILNRKYFIKHAIEKLAASMKDCQLVILAAGKSPLALELLVKRPEIQRIFEVDISGMDEKMRLYRELIPDQLERISCLTLDITSCSIIDEFEKNGYQRDVPTILLLEGISYYLSKDALRKTLYHFRSEGKNAVVLEYLVPPQEVELSRRHIPQRLFDLIRDESLVEEIRCYTEKELRTLFTELGGGLENCHSMKDMELLRCKINKYFQSHKEGWIECVVASI